MSGGISYCSAFQEDEIFGAITDSFLYRWTGSCIAILEYEPEDMLKAVFHALASSESPNTPFLVALFLPLWEIHTVELYSNSRPPKHVDPHPDTDGARAVRSRT